MENEENPIEILRKLMNSKGLTQTNVAKQCEVTTPYINQVLNGKRKPSKKLMLKLTDILCLPPFLVEQLSRLKLKDNEIECFPFNTRENASETWIFSSCFLPNNPYTIKLFQDNLYQGMNYVLWSDRKYQLEQVCENISSLDIQSAKEGKILGILGPGLLRYISTQLYFYPKSGPKAYTIVTDSGFPCSQHPADLLNSHWLYEAFNPILADLKKNKKVEGFEIVYPQHVET